MTVTERIAIERLVKTSQQATFEDLSEDTIRQVFDYLPSLRGVSQVNRSFHQVANQARLDELNHLANEIIQHLQRQGNRYANEIERINRWRISNSCTSIVKIRKFQTRIIKILRNVDDQTLSKLQKQLNIDHRSLGELLIRRSENINDEAAKQPINILEKVNKIKVQIREEFIQAAKSGSLPHVQFLLEQEPLCQDVLDDALLHAAEQGHEHIVRFLLRYYEQHNILLQDKPCGQLLVFAAQNGDENLVRDLIGNEHLNIDQDWILDAAIEAVKNGHETIVRLLLQNGQIAGDDRGWAVVNAAEHGHENIVRLLLQNGPIRENDRILAVINAAEHGHETIVQLLLENNAFIPDIFWIQALISAAKNGHINACKLLLSFGRAVYLRYLTFSIFGSAIAVLL